MISPPANVTFVLNYTISYSYINQRKMQVSINFHSLIPYINPPFLKNFSRNLNEYDKIVLRY